MFLKNNFFVFMCFLLFKTIKKFIDWNYDYKKAARLQYHIQIPKFFVQNPNIKLQYTYNIYNFLKWHVNLHSSLNNTIYSIFLLL